ncbi:DUF2723 domain-containing protein [Bacteroidales bacterium OttesenSCG-928-M11]|nr:DUF2723 domain-containing protein [Bacteroidales bacterium OttesenSCG-928-M11]
MKEFKLANNITGWIVFAIAAVVYLLTIEPTASFWDCGEFIVSAYKLEVGHPPGAPFFMLTGNLFTQLASDPSQVALMVNSMSAICSAFTILFLFWTITHLSRRLLIKDKGATISLGKSIAILGAGVVGSLAFTFSDTFWFSAVEGEVYAFSSMMTAVVFWLILKWDDVADEPHSGRWLILIAYIMGLSIGVHLLNLLCIPAIVLVYYFRKYSAPTLKGAILALLVSFGILAAILYGLIQGIMDVSGWFELFFVNALHMPYNSGVIIYIITVFAVLGWAIWETMKETPNTIRTKIAFVLSVILLGIPFIGDSTLLGFLIIAAIATFFYFYKKFNAAALNLILLCLLVITIGYSSYALIIVRSAANTPMDQNSPEDVFTLRDYLTREQYGETPLVYGRTFAARNVSPETKEGRPIYSRVVKKDSSERDRYIVARKKQITKYPDNYNMLFPRMHSSADDRHISAYEEWTGSRLTRPGTDGSTNYIQPSFATNLKFFFSYQVNYMYWRYFMWNFSGRQNDIQGQGEITNGNWITGIKFIDKHLIGPQEDMPDFIVENKGYNKYYMLPLILGLLGIFFQVYSGKKGTQQFWVIFILFFMTGLAIVIYLNQPPHQVRERDYAYAGSFYTFCIWIGLGTLALVHAIKKYLKAPSVVASTVGVLISLFIPVQMASQNWDDHDRSGRYVMRDFGHNYLVTCEKDAVIFTYGDNDTFPLWYNQEVEGVRTDVRVCNMSYLQGDWYINQMKMQAYDSAPLDIRWNEEDYAGTKLEAAYIAPSIPYIEASSMLSWVKSDDPKTKYQVGKHSIDIIPSEKIIIPIDSSAIVRAGLVPADSTHWLTSPLIIDASSSFETPYQSGGRAKSYLTKSEMMMIEMLNNNKDWSRPFYFAATVGSEQQLRLDHYLRNDGVAQRIMPYPTSIHGQVNSDILYDNIMNKYRWGNLEQEGLYIDENTSRMCRSFRQMFAILAEQLIEEGDFVRAKEVLDRGLQVIPEYNVPYHGREMTTFGKLYAEIGEVEKGLEIYTKMIENSLHRFDWFTRMNDKQYFAAMGDIQMEKHYMERFYIPFFHVYDEEAFEKYYKQYEPYYYRYSSFMESFKR